MTHVDFGPFPSVNVVKGRVELLSDPVTIMRSVKHGLHQTPSNPTRADKACLEKAGRRAKGKESSRQTLFAKSPDTADSVGAQGSLSGEQRKGNPCWRGKERFALHHCNEDRSLRPQAAKWGAEHCHHTGAQQPAPNFSVPHALGQLDKSDTKWPNNTLWFTHLLPWPTAEEH